MCSFAHIAEFLVYYRERTITNVMTYARLLKSATYLMKPTLTHVSLQAGRKRRTTYNRMSSETVLTAEAVRGHFEDIFEKNILSKHLPQFNAISNQFLFKRNYRISPSKWTFPCCEKSLSKINPLLVKFNPDFLVILTTILLDTILVNSSTCFQNVKRRQIFLCLVVFFWERVYDHFSIHSYDSGTDVFWITHAQFHTPYWFRDRLCGQLRRLFDGRIGRCSLIGLFVLKKSHAGYP